METRKQQLLVVQNKAVLRIQIRMFLGLLDPDPFVRGTDPGSGSFYHQEKKNSKKNLDSDCFVTFFMTFYL
jgi:hypothetical protein